MDMDASVRVMDPSRCHVMSTVNPTRVDW